MDRFNISIILLDTMRLDEFALLEKRFGSFGGLGFRFLDNCIAPSSWTLPSHASLFTGLYPSKHGAHETPKIKSLDIERIRLKLPMFVRDLGSVGYTSYGISANPYVHPIYGFSGFDSFKEESYFTDIFGSVIEISEKLKPKIAKYRNVYGNNLAKLSFNVLMDDPNLFVETIGSMVTRTPNAAMKKLRARLIDGWPIEKGGKNIVRDIKKMEFKVPYFLFANLMEAHDPYIGKRGKDYTWATPFLKKPPAEKLVNTWKRLYSKGALKAYRYALEIVKTMVDRYGGRQVFIITSDHGQAFNEHGFIGHGTVLYDEVLRVPMAIKMPEGTRYEAPKKMGFCSLVNVKEFLFEVLKSNRKAFEKFSNKIVYAESFGIPAHITINEDIDKAKIKANEKRKVRKFSI